MSEVRRLVTRSDFDGLACAMMLKEMDMIDEIKFVHPKDVQDGKVELTKNDITTNLPFDPRVGMAFDHHESEIDRLKAVETDGKLIIDENAKSAARVVYDYFGGKERFPNISDDLMEAVDKGDSAYVLSVNKEFHEIIYKATGSRFMSQVLRSYKEYIEQTTRPIFYESKFLQQIVDEHRAIVAGFEKHDADAAVAAMSAHMTNSMGRAEYVYRV